MFHLGVRYLTGYVAASDVADRRLVEWPPHPGRVFLALACAHFETGADREEHRALEWLEQQSAPHVHAGGCSPRTTPTAYVPVNDIVGPSRTPVPSCLGPLRRDRQPRVFTRAHLESEYVSYSWPGAEPGSHWPALQGLCAKVARLGHASSLVQVWCTPESPRPSPAWIPDSNEPSRHFRVPHRGLLAQLASDPHRDGLDPCADSKGRPSVGRSTRSHPELPFWVGYRPCEGWDTGTAAPAATIFEPHLLAFEFRPARVGPEPPALTSTLWVTRRLRAAFLSRLGMDPIPESLSGHRGAARAVSPHLAFLALPARKPDGALGDVIGAAIVTPRGLAPDERARMMAALAGVQQTGVDLGWWGRWQLSRLESAARAFLRPRSWTGGSKGSRHWATVTPFVFDRHSSARDDARYHAELLEGVRLSCQRVGLPDPEDIWLSRVSAHRGAPAAREFPRLQRKEGTECRHLHIGLRFPVPVVGPVLLGAGRFQGYGLCRPQDEIG